VFLSLKELELRKIDFSVAIPAGQIDYQDLRLRQQAALEATGRAELLTATLQEIRVRGHLRVRMEGDCDRCLEAVVLTVETDFDVCYRPVGFAALGADEVEIGEAESDIAFYEGDGVELNDVLREQVVLSLPMQRLCGEHCRGICPVCGQNRNTVDCECQTKMVDDRWAALKQI